MERTITTATERAAARRARRFERMQSGYGRLHLPLGAPEGGVRRQCTTCGAHLLAAPGSGTRLHGVCMVCGGIEHRPID